MIQENDRSLPSLQDRVMIFIIFEWFVFQPDPRHIVNIIPCMRVFGTIWWTSLLRKLFLAMYYIFCGFSYHGDCYTLKILQTNYSKAKHVRWCCHCFHGNKVGSTRRAIFLWLHFFAGQINKAMWIFSVGRYLQAAQGVLRVERIAVIFCFSLLWFVTSDFQDFRRQSSRFCDVIHYIVVIMFIIIIIIIFLIFFFDWQKKHWFEHYSIRSFEIASFFGVLYSTLTS